MNKRTKKVLKISGITMGSLLIAMLVVIAIVINFIFTPTKLTPVVLNAANQSLNAELNMESVELTFFSTFPQFGLKVKRGTLVSKVLNDTSWVKTDSLLTFKECVVALNPLAYLTNKQISIHNITLENASIYAYRDKEGKANWDIAKNSTDSLAQDTATTAGFDSEIDIRNIELKHTNIIFDDRSTSVYSRIDDGNLKLKLSLTKGISTLKLAFDNKNILFWQQGELLVNKLFTSLQTDVRVDRATRIWTLNNTALQVNGIQLDVDGTLQRDTVTNTLDMDLRYGLHAPSMETVLNLIPKAYVKDNKVTAQGEVNINGTVKGSYGEQKLPAVSLNVSIKKASAQYKGLPYGIDTFTTELDAYVDLMRVQPSFLNLKILHFKGTHTEIQADAKVEDLLGDPLITFHTTSGVDLDALAQTFPLQESVTIRGKLDANIRLKCRLSSLKKQDIGRIKLSGELDLKDFELKDTAKDFDFLGHATLRFGDNETLQAQADVRRLVLKSPSLNADIERLIANISSTNPLDTTRIVSLKCDVEASKLRAEMGDSLRLYCGLVKVQGGLSPSEKNATKPRINFSLRSDSLFFRFHDSKLGMNVAGIRMEADKVNDTLWIPRGLIGFDRLRLRTPELGLPIYMQKTALTVDGPKITLKNASLNIGRSDINATGSIEGIYRAMTYGEKLKAHLAISSDLIDCTQLINSFSFPQDSVGMLTDTTSAAMQIFVIPAAIDFELKTDLKQVLFDKMVFDYVQGNVNIRDQAVHLENLTMRALDADMKAVMVYRARSNRGGYVGFDFRIHNINVAKLVDFIPSLDTIVPMLRSFKGRVQFDVAADARLDSAMNIRIPTLRSAIHIKGDSLVLMDGDSFAEISKMLMFKNKKENVFDSIAVNVTVHDGNVTIYPFLVEIDRYKAAIGGRQGLDMSLDYHISILKSPLPFKAGVNITGTPDKMKFRIGKAKYKDAVTPAEVHRVDSTRMNMGDEIVNRFRRVIR